MTNKEYKRQYRDMDDRTKEKISASLRHRKLPYSHREAISSGMTEYWRTVPYRDSSDRNGSKSCDGSLSGE